MSSKSSKSSNTIQRFVRSLSSRRHRLADEPTAPTMHGQAVQFDMLEPRILLSTITSVGTGDWSDPNTWDLGTTPGAGDDVVIGSSDTVTYDTTDSDILGSVDIDGTLTFDANTSLDLYSEGNIEVSGVLEMNPASASVVAHHHL